jgi:signal transduction histidine kinase
MRLWPRSFALRAALAAAGVVVLVCVLGFGWGYLRAQEALRAQIDIAMRAEAESFVTDFEANGLTGLVETVMLHSRRRSSTRVQLQTVGGQVLAGSVPGTPPALRGLATLRPAEGGSWRAMGVLLPAGLNLIVAADLEQTDRTAAAMASTLPAAGALAGLAALALGFVTAKQLERRLHSVSAAAQAVMAGDLTQRLPVHGGGDEFDRLVVTINAMLTRIEELVREMRQVTNNIAHDLRSPLSRLRQKLEGALARAREPAADGEALAEAIDELDAVLTTFASLLRIARAEAGLRGAPPQQVALSELAGQMAETYAAVAEEEGQSLVAEVAPDVTVRGDATLLRQALANLIENALLHGGPAVQVRVILRREAGAPMLEVIDNGPGIPAEERDRVTRRFYRLDRSRNTPGTGLGLALVAAVAQLHGARLRLEDAAPGLRVSIAFPAAD